MPPFERQLAYTDYIKIDVKQFPWNKTNTRDESWLMTRKKI